MRLFICTCCANIIYFENRSCEICGKRLGYFPETNRMYALESSEDKWLSLGELKDFKFCDNAADDACNWLLPADCPDKLCAACSYNRTIPDLSIGENRGLWRKFELAKHHMFYGLLKLRLPLETRRQNPDFGLAFDILEDGVAGPVLTGHQDGVITLNLAEAEDAERERRRTDLGEPYRTLLGHFRHEIGHYYWDRLVREGGKLDGFRDHFGDERADYLAALKDHYANGAPPEWRDYYVSAYASAHPWEDFAETWAHFLHIVDTMEMAGSLGLRVDPRETDNAAYSAEVNFDPHNAVSISQLVRRWLPITGAVNSINRCMGQPDLYPFVLTPGVIRKLDFILELVRHSG